MADLETKELLLVTQQSADCAQLLQLDDVWTSMAVGGLAVGLSNLETMVSEIKPLIYGVSERALTVQAIAERNTEVLDETTRNLLSSGQLSESDRTDLVWFLRRHGRDSVIEVLRGASQALADPKSEAQNLDEQLRRITEEQYVTGDFSKKFRCGLSSSLIGGSILSLPSTAVASLGVLAAGGAVAGVTGMFLTGGVGAIAILVAGLFVARRSGC